MSLIRSRSCSAKRRSLLLNVAATAAGCGLVTSVAATSDSEEVTGMAASLADRRVVYGLVLCPAGHVALGILKSEINHQQEELKSLLVVKQAMSYSL